MKTLHYDRFDSPIGTIFLAVDGEYLCALDFEEFEQRTRTLLQRRYGTFALVAEENPQGMRDKLASYFAGDYSCLDTIPVSTGGTDFQRKVWQALRTIQPGTTMSYGELAASLGKPTAYRAVGATNALNPVAIVLPCHRVVGSDASLTGYAGGLERKQWLLQHEGYTLQSRKGIKA